MPSSVEPRTIVVTGAGSGIGFSVALRLARCNYRVVAVDIRARGLQDLARTADERGLSVDTCVADAANEDEVAAIFLDASRRSEPLHGSVLCAGVTRRLSVLETTVEDLAELSRVNLASALLGIRETGRALRGQKRPGAILVVSSINAFRALPSQAAYSATKAAIESLVTSAALDLGPHGVRVNALAPGAILTPMNPDLAPDGDLAKRVPLGRVGRASDLDGAAQFLLSDDASYITGASLVVDGGLMHVR